MKNIITTVADPEISNSGGGRIEVGSREGA